MANYPKNLPRVSNATTPCASDNVVVKVFLAGEAITAGNVVRWAEGNDAAGDADGYTVMQGDANKIPVGVAMETAADGFPVLVQVYGINQVAMVTGQSAANTGTLLYIGAAGATAESELGSITDGDLVLGCVGISLTADSGTALAAGSAMLFPFGSRA